jgi:dihydroneopterin aldolase
MTMNQGLLQPAPAPPAAAPLAGLVPEALQPRTHRIMLEDLELPVDIGFHDFEIGTPQRLRVNIEVWLSPAELPQNDVVAEAWDYDHIHSSAIALASSRRFNLQETLVQALYAMVAARAGVIGVRVSTRKPDIYPDCGAVGVELSSF